MIAACDVGVAVAGDTVLPRRFPSEGAIDGTMEGVSDGRSVTAASVGGFVGVLPTMSTWTGDNDGDAVGGVVVLSMPTGIPLVPVQQTGANSFRTL